MSNPTPEAARAKRFRGVTIFGRFRRRGLSIPARSVRLLGNPNPETPMQYLLLIYDDEKATMSMSQEAQGRFMGEYMEFTESIKKSGNMVAGDALQPTSTATTVRVRDGKTLTTDGPFAETREQLGGYYLVEAKNLDEAIAIAARIPSAKMGSIEVRPIQTFG
jgi:hypothetical protein